MAGASARLLAAAVLLAAAICPASASPDGMLPANENGYEAWLRYRPLANVDDRTAKTLRRVHVAGSGPRAAAVRDELALGLNALLGVQTVFDDDVASLAGGVYAGTRATLGARLPAAVSAKLAAVGTEGYVIAADDSGQAPSVFIASNDEAGLVFAAFRFLRELQLGADPAAMDIVESPAMPLRMINHWDNLDRSVERVYGGFSIFDWPNLPASEVRYRDYSRLMASIGINGIVVNNVNTYKEGRLNGWRIISDEYLEKAATLAREFDRYGIEIYFSVNFMSPILFGDLDTADPVNSAVQAWWRDRAARIKRAIPSFGGFLVKADSEGEQGPHSYDRTHAEGANMLARALAPVDGVVIWRAFVYKHPELSGGNPDRAVQAFEQFRPLDGRFADNVILQVKYGPIDFQVNEPVSSLFSVMPKTNLMLELQITQEYTGNDVHLNFLAPFWRSIYAFDTYRDGPGSRLMDVLKPAGASSRAWGVAGIGNFHDGLNWTGHLLAQSNTYAYGMLAWNPEQSSKKIAAEWTELSFGRDAVVVATISDMLLRSYRTYSNYYFPNGLSLMGWAGGAAGDGNGDRSRPDPYRNIGRYHQTDANGTGYDRTMATGSGYIAQYPQPLRDRYESAASCPPESLLWFHYLPYTHRMPSGKTLIQSIYDDRYDGVDGVRRLREDWLSLAGRIDEERFYQVLGKLNLQLSEALIWRDVVNGFYLDMSGIPDAHGRVAKTDRPYRGLRYGRGPRSH